MSLYDFANIVNLVGVALMLVFIQGQPCADQFVQLP